MAFWNVDRPAHAVRAGRELGTGRTNMPSDHCETGPSLTQHGLRNRAPHHACLVAALVRLRRGHRFGQVGLLQAGTESSGPGAGMKGMWRIELLGELRVQHADRVITRFPTQKAGVLLAYLAYYPQHPHPRDALIEQLWPEIDLDAARSSLRNALYSLRQLLERDEGAPGTLLIASRSTVSLHPGAFTTDVADFRAALQAAGRTDRPAERAARLSSALECYHGELLPGYYEAWILQERRFLA